MQTDAGGENSTQAFPISNAGQFNVESRCPFAGDSARLGSPLVLQYECTRRWRMDTGPIWAPRSTRVFAGVRPTKRKQTGSSRSLTD